MDSHLARPRRVRSCGSGPHPVTLALVNLCQANREFGAYYAGFLELMDILKTTDDTSRCQALKRGLNHKMLSAFAIYTTPKDESFDEYVVRLNELDCRLHALATHTRNQHRPQAPRTPTPASAGTATGMTTVTATGTATGIAAGPMDLSAARKKLTPPERQCRRTQGLCIYCGGVGHFTAEYPARRTGTAGTSGCRAPESGRLEPPSPTLIPPRSREKRSLRSSWWQLPGPEELVDR